jgi:Mg2+ and Co2+ transporter CorA
MIRYFAVHDENLIAHDEMAEDVIWADLESPRLEEIPKIAGQFNLDIELLNEFIEPTHRSRYTFDFRSKLHIFILQLIKDLSGIRPKIPTYPFILILNAKNQIVTIHTEEFFELNSIVDKMNKHHLTDPLIIFLDLMQKLLMVFHKNSSNFALKIAELHEYMNNATEINAINKGFEFKSYLGFFNSAMLGNSDVIRTFANRNRKMFEMDLILMEKMKELEEEAINLYQSTEKLTELVPENLAAYASTINLRVFHVIKVVAAITLILNAANAIASFWTANLTVPGGIKPSNPITFYIMLLISFGFSSVIWIIFRKRKFL